MPPVDTYKDIQSATEASRQVATERAQERIEEQVAARQPDVDAARSEVEAAFQNVPAETDSDPMQSSVESEQLNPQEAHVEQDPDVLLQQAKAAIGKGLETIIKELPLMEHAQDALHRQAVNQISKIREELQARMRSSGATVPPEDLRWLSQGVDVIMKSVNPALGKEKDKKALLTGIVRNIGSAAGKEILAADKREVLGGVYHKLYGAAKVYDSEGKLGDVVSRMGSLLRGNMRNLAYGLLISELTRVENELRTVVISKQQNKGRNPAQFQQLLEEIKIQIAGI